MFGQEFSVVGGLSRVRGSISVFAAPSFRFLLSFPRAREYFRKVFHVFA